MKIKLAADLEKALLRSIADGICKPDIVSAEELSKNAKHAYESICHLLKKSKPPVKGDSILLQAQAMFGVDRDDFKSYLRSFKELDVGAEVSEILRSAREKTLLVRLINEAGTQLSNGHLDARELGRLMEANGAAPNPISALSMSVQDKFPVPPTGIPIKSLKHLSSCINGLIGMVIIGGEPGLGKSTLGFQLALDAAGTVPAIYYDLDGTGHVWLLHRAKLICRGDIKTFKRITQQFYLRESIHSLEDDIAFIRKEHDGEIVVVIDSLQTLPTSIKYKKEGLDSWINRFKQLTKKKVVVIGISEQNRANYGEARMAGFKGSGDIEYAGSCCIQLLKAEDADDEDDPTQVHIVKNRHGPKKGHIIDLVRDEDKVFWMKEEEID